MMEERKSGTVKIWTGGPLLGTPPLAALFLPFQDQERRTPLHAAAYVGDIPILQLLLMSGESWEQREGKVCLLGMDPRGGAFFPFSPNWGGAFSPPLLPYRMLFSSGGPEEAPLLTQLSTLMPGFLSHPWPTSLKDELIPP